jgi:hypothetical protein
VRARESRDGRGLGVGAFRNHPPQVHGLFRARTEKALFRTFLESGAQTQPAMGRRRASFLYLRVGSAGAYIPACHTNLTGSFSGATPPTMGRRITHLVPGVLDDVELPRRGDDAGRAGAADVGEERVEEGAVGGDGAALERAALVEDAAAQEESLSWGEGFEGLGLLRALESKVGSGWRFTSHYYDT